MNRFLSISLQFLIIFHFDIGYANNQLKNEVNNKSSELKDSFIINKIRVYDLYYSQSQDSNFQGEKILYEILSYAKSKKDYHGQFLTYYRLGKIEHARKKNDVKAVKHFFESMKYAELAGNNEYISKTYNYLGIIFYANHKYDDAIKYFKVAMNTRWNGENTFRSIPFYLSGLSYYELRQYDMAMQHFNTALDMVKKTGDQDRVHEIELGMAKVLVDKKQYRDAELLIGKTLDYYQRNNERVAIAVAYTLYSRISYSENRLSEALDYCLKAERNSNMGNDISGHKIAIAQLLYEINYKMGKLQEAHDYLLKVQSLKDATASLDVTSQIALTYAKYRNELERNQLNETITRQKEDNRKALIAAGVLGGLFLVIGFLLLFVRKERQKSELLIHNILPAQTVKQLKTYGKAIPQRHDAVTVMFCDVKEFTSLASTLEPETLINILDFYFGKFDSIISSYSDIEKIKTIGDAYLCVSGLNNTPNHALSMVNAAYEIIRFVEESHNLVHQKFGYSIDFRIGIHSGSLISGVVGTHKYAYDVWGDTVNVAARMESSGSPGKINISQATFDYVQPYFVCEQRGMIEVKNGLKLDMYYVLDKITKG
jgi:class 3 adenylate cyclase/predicted nucleic acid-binding protein